jgi:hypothetical protein
VPKFIDPDFAKTRQNRSFSVIENKRFGLVFAKTGSINSGTGKFSSVKFIFLVQKIIVKKASSLIRKNSKITSWVDGVPIAAGWASGQKSESGSPRLLASPGPAGAAGKFKFHSKDDSKLRRQ